jgi:Tol biopolymer transport system component
MKKHTRLMLLVALSLACGQVSNSQAPANSAVKKIAFVVGHWKWAYEAGSWSESDTHDEIFILDSPTAEPRWLVDGVSPVLSPTGEKLAFCTRSKTAFGQAEIINADGSGRMQVTNLRGGACPTDWSPDGAKLLITACGEGTYDNCAAGKPVVLVLDSNGKNMAQLVEGYAARWSPDGSLIVFCRHLRGLTGPGSIWIADGDGKNERQIIEDRFSLLEASWFPDGKSVVFSSNRHDDRDTVFRVNSDGSNLQEIANDKHFSLFAADVSPDATQLVVQGIKSSNDWRVLLFDLRTHHISTLAHGLHQSVLWEKH